jgi:hypothetical protein
MFLSRGEGGDGGDGGEGGEGGGEAASWRLFPQDFREKNEPATHHHSEVGGPGPAQEFAGAFAVCIHPPGRAGYV